MTGQSDQFFPTLATPASQTGCGRSVFQNLRSAFVAPPPVQSSIYLGVFQIWLHSNDPVYSGART